MKPAGAAADAEQRRRAEDRLHFKKSKYLCRGCVAWKALAGNVCLPDIQGSDTATFAKESHPAKRYSTIQIISITKEILSPDRNNYCREINQQIKISLLSHNSKSVTLQNWKLGTIGTTTYNFVAAKNHFDVKTQTLSPKLASNNLFNSCWCRWWKQEGKEQIRRSSWCGSFC